MRQVQREGVGERVTEDRSVEVPRKLQLGEFAEVWPLSQ